MGGFLLHVLDATLQILVEAKNDVALEDGEPVHHRVLEGPPVECLAEDQPGMDFAIRHLLSAVAGSPTAGVDVSPGHAVPTTDVSWSRTVAPMGVIALSIPRSTTPFCGGDHTPG